MPRKVQFEGVTHSFPDDATDDEIAAALGGGAPAPPDMNADALGDMPVAQPEQRGTLESAMRMLGIFGEGANSGMAKVAELPYDAVNNLPRIANILPGEQGVGRISEMVQGIPILGDLFAGADPLQDIGRSAGMIDATPPETRPERIVHRVGEEVGANVIPAVGLTARAARLPSGVTAANEMNFLDRALALPFKNSPVAANVAEATAAAGAGAGAQLAKETVNDDPLTELLGGVAGGVTAGGLINKAGSAARSIGDIFTDRQARLATGERLADTATNPDAAFSDGTVARAADLNTDVPGTRVTAGQASSDPGVLKLEYERSRGGPNVSKFQAREAENRAAVRDELDTVAPKEQTDEATRATLEGRKQSATQKADDIVAAKARERDSAAADAEPKQSVSDAGREIRKTAEAAEDTLTDLRDAEALPLLRSAEESGAAVDASPVVAKIDEVLARSKRPVVRSALQEARASLNATGAEDALDDTVTGLYESRKAINDIIAGRSETSTGRYAKSELIEVRDALDDALSEAAPEFGQYLQKFRQGSGPLNDLKEGAVGKVTEKNPLTGTPKVPDSEVAAQFWNTKSGNKESLEQFKAQLGGNKEATAALRDAALADAKKAATKNGEVDPKALNAWMDRHRDHLDMFPDIETDLRRLGEAQADVAASAARADKLKGDLSNPRKSTIARYLEPEEATKSMGAILSGKRPQEEARNLMRLVRKDKKAVEGVKRAFFDSLETAADSTVKDHAGNVLLKKDAFIKFLNKNEKVSKEILGAGHTKTLRKIADQLDVLQQTSNIKPSASSGTPAAQGTGITLNSVLSRVYGIQRGVVSPRFVASELLARQIASMARKFKGKKIDNLLDEALLDPELAKTLVMEFTQENERLITRRMPAIMARFGLKVGRTALTTDDEESDSDD